MPDTEPVILATVRNISFGNTPTYFDVPNPPPSLMGLVQQVIAARVMTHTFARGVVADPQSETCAAILREAAHDELEHEWALTNWFRVDGRRWNRYRVAGYFVFATKGDDQGRFYSCVCDAKGRVPCCGCGGFGMRVEPDFDAVPYVYGIRVARRCPICEGRGNILVAPWVEKLAKEEVSHVNPVA